MNVFCFGLVHSITFAALFFRTSFQLTIDLFMVKRQLLLNVVIRYEWFFFSLSLRTLSMKLLPLKFVLYGDRDFAYKESKSNGVETTRSGNNDAVGIYLAI